MFHIYVASSWRNEHQPDVVEKFKRLGYAPYDFRKDGFGWHETDPEWESWDYLDYKDALLHPRAVEGFTRDMQALDNSDCLVMVLPCGASSHLELGYAIGAGKPTVIYYPPEVSVEPELMYKAATAIVRSTLDLNFIVGQIETAQSQVKEGLQQLEGGRQMLRDVESPC